MVVVGEIVGRVVGVDARRGVRTSVGRAARGLFKVDLLLQLFVNNVTT